MTWLALAGKVLAWLLGCRQCLYVMAIGAALVGSNWLGQHKARTECREAQVRARLANAQADLAETKRAAADANARANAIEANASDQRKEDAAYIASLKARPACDLTDADIGGLPNHRNRNGARPAARAR